MDELNPMELAAQAGKSTEPVSPTQSDGHGEDSEESKSGTAYFNGAHSYVQKCFIASQEFKKETEKLWLRLNFNFDGTYHPDDLKRVGDNDLFIKLTRKEVMKAAARINTILNNRQNRAWAIFPTPIPDVKTPDQIDPALMSEMGGPMGGTPMMEGGAEAMGQQSRNPFELQLPGVIPPGAIPNASVPSLGLGQVGQTPASPVQAMKMGYFNQNNGSQGQDGMGASPMPMPGPQAPGQPVPTSDPVVQSRRMALAAAHRMTDVIEDCFVETRYDEKLNRGLLDLCLFGTMVFFGPIHRTGFATGWSQGPNGYQRRYEEMPKSAFDIEHINVWDFYPEPGAESIDDASWCIVRRFVTKSQLRRLKNAEGYKADAIDEALQTKPSGNPLYWQAQLEKASENHSTSIGAQRYELLDWWGFLTSDDLEEMGLELEEGADDQDYIWNIQTVGGKVIYMESSEFHRDRLPFYLTPFERIPRKLWGRGPAEMMEDSQRMINACARAQAKNFSYSAGPLLTVDTSRATGNYTRIMPDKVYTFKNTDASNNTNPYAFINVPSISQEMQSAISFYKAMVPEMTSLPELMNGINDSSGNRTIGQFSMLMSNGDAYLRLVITNLDTTFTQPLIRNAYEWQMMYNDDASIKGDMTVEARGVSGVMANEMRVAKMNELYREIRQDDTADTWIKKDRLFLEMLKGLEMESEEFVRTPEEAQAYTQQKIADAQAQAQAVNLPKPKPELSDKDALMAAIAATPPEDPAFDILLATAAQQHQFLTPDLQEALRKSHAYKVELAADKPIDVRHKRAIEAANVHLKEQETAIKAEGVRLQINQKKAGMRVLRDSKGAVIGLQPIGGEA